MPAETGRTRVVAGGVACIALYLLVAALSFTHGWVRGRPIYDGLAPDVPYNWVRPPPELAPTNIPALGGEATISFGPAGSKARSVATDDGQAFIVFPIGAFQPGPDGEDEIQIEVTPLDPEGMATPPGHVVDGNAYEVTAVYAGSGARAEPVSEFDVVLTFPRHAVQVLLYTGGDEPVLVDTQTTQGGSKQVFGKAGDLGVFAASGPPGGSVDSGFDLRLAIGGGLVVLGALGGLWSVRRGRTAATDR